MSSELYTINEFNDSEVIARAMEAFGCKTKKALADLFEISPQDFANRERRGSLVPLILKPAVNRCVNINWLLTGLGEMNLPETERQLQAIRLQGFTLVPKYKVRLSGGPGNYVLEQDVEQHLSFKTAWIRRRCPVSSCGLFTVTGDSMAPHIADGDIVLVDMSRNEPGDIADGKVYAFSEWDTVKVKRLIRQGPKIMAQSDNTLAMTPAVIEVDLEQFRLIGKVIWVGHEVK